VTDGLPMPTNTRTIRVFISSTFSDL